MPFRRRSSIRSLSKIVARKKRKKMLDTLGGVNEKARMTNTPQTKKIAKEVLLLMLAAVGAGVLVVSCAWHPVVQAAGGSSLEYVVSFGDDPPNADHRVHLKSESAFLAALHSPPPPWIALKIRDVSDGPESVIQPPGTPTGTPTCGSFDIPHSAKLASTHVTQKVGLNDAAQLAKVLEAVGPQ
jgi:hypothetical protein